MKETKVIKESNKPNTKESIINDLRNIGVEEGMTIIVHSSLRTLGWVCGGAVAVVQALMDVVTDKGTIVMPSQSVDNSDPSEWENPPVPEEWWQIIRENMPAYNPAFTSTRGMGKIVETFRFFPNVKRSNHPTYSFAAWGKYADYILSEQPLEEGFGSQSPLGKIYELDGKILLIGVGHDSDTSIHLAEHSVINSKLIKKGSALVENGKRIWKEYDEINYNSDVFEELGGDFEKMNPIITGRIGLGECKLIRQREIVDFAKEWLNSKKCLV